MKAIKEVSALKFYKKMSSCVGNKKYVIQLEKKTGKAVALYQSSLH